MEQFPRPGTNERRKESKEPTESVFHLEDKDFVFKTYDIGKTNDLPNPGLMVTGAEKVVMKMYEDDPLILNKHTGERYARIPYGFLYADNSRVFGNYATEEGQNEFLDSDLLLTQQSFTPPPWAEDLWRFARLKNPRTFTKDETLACLRGLNVVNGKLRFTVGPGLYSDAFYSMGSEGVTTDITDAQREALAARVPSEHMQEFEQLLEKLQGEYGAGKQIRDIIHSRSGRVPEFGDHVYNSLFGVAGTVLTRDGEYVLVRRGKNVSINRGINVTASGAVQYDADTLSRYGIQHHLGQEMHREAQEEIGLKSGTLLLGSMQRRLELELGVDHKDYDLVPVGFARELMRGGSPEMMFLIRYKGSTKDLVDTITNNPHSERQEIDQFVYALPQNDAHDLIKTPNASAVIQHKGVLNLALIHEYLLNHSV